MQSEKIIGVNSVREVLRAGRPIQRLLIAEQRKRDRDVAEIIRLAKERGVEIRMSSRDALDREARDYHHQGVIAVASARSYATLDDILHIPAQRKEEALFL